MTHFDVFNGDADGICALHQLRLAQPTAAVLVTGVKRDIALLERVAPIARPGDTATVLDVSLDVNRAALRALLGGGVAVDYVDHHFAGEIPRDERLTTVIDPSPAACTSSIVDGRLDGAYRAWAIVGAFGDNIAATARALAARLGLAPEATEALRTLGENLNYNAYGDTEADLVIPPADLYRRVSACADPWRFAAEEPVLREIDAARHGDLQLARATAPTHTVPGGAIYVLPDEPWSRRIRGAFGYDLANTNPHLAHAVVTSNAAGDYTISVRAPISAPHGADALCRRFPSGGGRSGAAGVNHLRRADLPSFVRAFAQAYP